jgi:hypothetical protein
MNYLDRINFLKSVENEQDDLVKIEKFVDFYKSLPIQGSKEWAENRKIGASQISTILGKNKNQDIWTFCLYFYKILKFEGNSMTEWGNLFEPVAKLYLSRKIKIYETGSIPGFGENGIDYLSCSPDGLFVIPEELNSELKGKACLLEIKCPPVRKIEDTIPNIYKDQMYMGMEIIPFCTYSYFTDFKIVTCSMLSFDFSSTNTSKFSSTNNIQPIAIGFIGFYGEYKNEIIKKKD